MYNDETLPPERDNNWKGRLLPHHGISPKDWWPTLEEVELIDNYILSDKYAENSLQILGLDDAQKLNKATGVKGLLNWFVDNFVKEEYTDNYSKSVTFEMIDRGALEYLRTSAKLELKQIDKFQEILRKRDNKK